MKLIILPVLVLTYFYFTVAESALIEMNKIGERVERQQNRVSGRSPAIAYEGNKGLRK